MKKTIKFISILMTLLIVMTSIPFNAFAEESSEGYEKIPEIENARIEKIIQTMGVEDPSEINKEQVDKQTDTEIETGDTIIIESESELKEDEDVSIEIGTDANSELEETNSEKETDTEIEIDKSTEESKGDSIEEETEKEEKEEEIEKEEETEEKIEDEKAKKSDLATLVIKNIDKDTREVLEGNEFELTNKAGELVSENINELNYIIFENLDKGEYELSQTKISEGYVVKGKREWIITVNSDYSMRISAKNDRKKRNLAREYVEENLKKLTKAFFNKELEEFPNKFILLLKYEKDKGQRVKINVFERNNMTPVSGAKFALKKADGTVIKIVTSSSNGYIDFHIKEDGEYIIEEVESPEEYKASLFNKTINIENSTSMLDDITFDAVYEPKSLGALNITKIDQNGYAVKDVKFELKGPEGSRMYLTTDRYGKASVTDLYDGNYTLQEIEAPENYVMDGTTYRFKVKQNSKIFDKGTEEENDLNKRSAISVKELSLLSSDPNYSEIYPVSGDYIIANTRMKIADTESVNPGDFFRVKFDGPINLNTYSDKNKLNVFYDEELVATGKIVEPNVIEYVFTDYVFKNNLREFNIETNLYVNREEATGNDWISIYAKAEGTTSTPVGKSIYISYNGFEKNLLGQWCGSSTVKINSDGSYESIYYINRGMSGNFPNWFELWINDPNENIEVDAIYSIDTKDFSAVPESFGIDPSKMTDRTEDFKANIDRVEKDGTMQRRINFHDETSINNKIFAIKVSGQKNPKGNLNNSFRVWYGQNTSGTATSNIILPKSNDLEAENGNSNIFNYRIVNRKIIDYGVNLVGIVKYSSNDVIYESGISNYNGGYGIPLRLINRDNGRYWDIWSNGNNIVIPSGLPNGNYDLFRNGKINNIRQDNNLLISINVDKERYYKLSGDGSKERFNNNNKTVYFYHNSTKRVVITKRDSRTNELLEGAHFEMWDKNRRINREGVTGKNGLLVFDGLPTGNYEFHETKAPEGYEPGNASGWQDANIGISSNEIPGYWGNNRSGSIRLTNWNLYNVSNNGNILPNSNEGRLKSTISISLPNNLKPGDYFNVWVDRALKGNNFGERAIDLYSDEVGFVARGTYYEGDSKIQFKCSENVANYTNTSGIATATSFLYIDREIVNNGEYAVLDRTFRMSTNNNSISSRMTIRYEDNSRVDGNDNHIGYSLISAKNGVATIRVHFNKIRGNLLKYGDITVEGQNLYGFRLDYSLTVVPKYNGNRNYKATVLNESYTKLTTGTAGVEYSRNPPTITSNYGNTMKINIDKMLNNTGSHVRGGYLEIKANYNQSYEQNIGVKCTLDKKAGIAGVIERSVTAGWRYANVQPDVRFSVPDNDVDVPITIRRTVYNDKIKKGFANIKFKKISTTGTALSNVNFRMEKLKDGKFEDLGENYSVVSGRGGEFSYTEMDKGSYRLIETEAPKGYYIESGKNSVVYRFYVNENGAVFRYTSNDNSGYWINNSDKQIIKNAPLTTTSLIIRKYAKDSENGNPRKLNGVTFELEGDNINKRTRTTKKDLNLKDELEDGIIVFNDLPYGNYTLKEIETLPGYHLQENVRKFTIGGSTEDLEEIEDKRNVSSKIEISDWTLKVFDKGDGEGVISDGNNAPTIHPNNDGYVNFDTEFSIKEGEKQNIKEGDYFIVHYSDNTDFGGLVPNYLIDADHALDLLANDQILAVAEIIDEHSIKYKFTNFFENMDIRYVSTKLNIYLDKNTIKKNGIATLSTRVDKSMNIQKGKVKVDYQIMGSDTYYLSMDRFDNKVYSFGGFINKVDKVEGSFTQYIYINPEGEKIGKSDIKIHSVQNFKIRRSDVTVYPVNKPSEKTMLPGYDYKLDDLSEHPGVDKPAYLYMQEIGKDVYINFSNSMRNGKGYIIEINGRFPKSKEDVNLGFREDLSFGSASMWGQQAVSFVTSGGDTDGDLGFNIYNVPNKLQFKKTDQNGDNVSGAKFSFKKWDQGSWIEVTEENKGMMDVTLPLKSTEEGFIDIKKIPDGHYFIKETEPPSGYILDEEVEFAFMVKNGYVTDFDGNEITLNDFNFKNKKEELNIEIPDTGATKVVNFTLMGSLVLLITLVLYRKNK